MVSLVITFIKMDIQLSCYTSCVLLSPSDEMHLLIWYTAAMTKGLSTHALVQVMVMIIEERRKKRLFTVFQFKVPEQ